MRKYLIIFFVTLLFGLKGYTRVDYTYCKEFIDKTNANLPKTGFMFPFTINLDGSLKRLSSIPASFNGEKKDQSSFKIKSPTNTLDIKINHLESNQISEIMMTTNFKDIPNTPSQIVSDIKFEIENNYCVPKKGKAKVFLKDGTRVESTTFDTRLCKDINDFFSKEKNKDLKKCLDLESKESKELVRIFEGNGYKEEDVKLSFEGNATPIFNRYSYSVEQKILTGHKPTAFMFNMTEKQVEHLPGVFGGSPVVAASMILNDCIEKGIGKVLSDQDVWRAQKKEKLIDVSEVQKK